MIYFSFNDFMDNQKTTIRGKNEKNGIIGVNEEIFNYRQENGKILGDTEIPPIIKILKEKEELIKFLNNFFQLNNLIENYSIKYCKNIKSNIEAKDTITIKVKERAIFIVIKEIKEKDTNIAYKMLNISSNIINQLNIQKQEKKMKNPIVIPIVIYTGKEKWENFRSIINNKVCYIQYEKNKIKFSYNMLKINQIDKKFLKSIDSKVSKTMIELQE